MTRSPGIDDQPHEEQPCAKWPIGQELADGQCPQIDVRCPGKLVSEKPALLLGHAAASQHEHPLDRYKRTPQSLEQC